MSNFKRITREISIFLLIEMIKPNLTWIQILKKMVRFNKKLHKTERLDWKYLNECLYENPKYKGTKRITHYGKTVFSQNGEDGIIDEIFKRIGTTNKFFVEFGLQEGIESNTALLLLKGWDGLWIEADKKYVSQINETFNEPIKSKQLKVKNSFVTPENIENIFDECGVPKELDLLSIDIDSTDYWVRKSINKYKPRVLIMEYNAVYFPPIVWIKKKDDPYWNNDINMGASLQAIHDLNKSKGYSLVGCDFNGVNAFFVRNDCFSEELFESDTSAEFHYETFKDLVPYSYHKKVFNMGDVDPDIKV